MIPRFEYLQNGGSEDANDTILSEPIRLSIRVKIILRRRRNQRHIPMMVRERILKFVTDSHVDPTSEVGDLVNDENSTEEAP